MAARLNKRHQDMVRDKIRASQLVKALEDHVLEDGKQKRDLSATQVTAALGLLKKCVPDLKATEHVGEGGGPIKLSIPVKYVDPGTSEKAGSTD